MNNVQQNNANVTYSLPINNLLSQQKIQTSYYGIGVGTTGLKYDVTWFSGSVSIQVGIESRTQPGFSRWTTLCYGGSAHGTLSLDGFVPGEYCITITNTGNLSITNGTGIFQFV